MSTEDTEESIEGLKQVVRQGKLTTSHDDASAAPQRQPMRRSQYALGAGDVDLWMGADVPLKTNVRAGVEPNAGNMSDDSPEFSEEEGENDQEASPVRSEDCSGGIEHTYEPSGSEALVSPPSHMLELTSPLTDTVGMADVKGNMSPWLSPVSPALSFVSTSGDSWMGDVESSEPMLCGDAHLGEVLTSPALAVEGTLWGEMDARGGAISRYKPDDDCEWHTGGGCGRRRIHFVAREGESVGDIVKQVGRELALLHR